MVLVIELSTPGPLKIFSYAHIVPAWGPALGTPAHAMWPYIMSHRTQTTLEDAQYERLEAEARQTGLGL